MRLHRDEYSIVIGIAVLGGLIMLLLLIVNPIH
jgi:hypothetical protein